MAKLGRIRGSQLVLLCCFAVLFEAGALTAPTASAGPLEGVTNPVTELGRGPVREVVETVAPVRETVEAATEPVQEVTESPPVKEVTETATAPVEGATKQVTPPAKAVAETVTRPSASPPVELPGSPGPQVSGAVGKAVSPAGSTTAVAEGPHQATKDDPVVGATGAVPPASKHLDASGPDVAISSAGAQEETAGQSSASPGSTDALPPAGNIFVPSPTKNGSTAAPLPRWVAYIWPAIALARPGLAHLVAHWETAVRLALGANDASGGALAVAGVHASGGRAGTADPSRSSPSPFSKIPSAIGHFPYNVSGAALGYILIVAIMVIALFAAIRWEIAHGRRGG